MSFHLIDLENWERKDCFNHFMNIAKSTYSLTVNIDITKLIDFIKKNNYRLYPTFTWIVSKAVNNHMEFRMGFDSDRNLGYYDTIFPDYSVLNDKTKIMDSLCTAYEEEFVSFYNCMVSDMENYKSSGAHTQRHSNFFIVSCLPWLNYSAFTATNESEHQFLFPMVTWGKYIELDGKVLMPLTLQIHHAVADGYHCSLFYNNIEQITMNPEIYLK
ncbi:CatA-like O-acetyltransferase [Oscillospiraceae bacterium PP1C4]